MTSGSEKKGKIAIVTGGGRGLGHAYAKRLASEGATIIVVDLKAEDGIVAELVGAGAEQAEFCALDLAQEAAIRTFAAHVLDRYGRVDILVNNAGLADLKPFLEIDMAYFRKMLTINVEAMFLLCQLFAPSMMRNGYGRIVNIASNTLGLVIPDLVAYVTSKGAVVGLTRALATELGQHGITVNCIAPGLTRTPATEANFPDGDAFELFAQSQAIKRPGLPQDLVGTMSFLTSDDAAFFTGQTMIVDGGLVRSV